MAPSNVIGETVENFIRAVGAWKLTLKFMTTIWCTAISVRGPAVHEWTLILIAMFVINHSSAHTAPSHSTSIVLKNNTKKCSMKELLTDTLVIFVHSRRIPMNLWLSIKKTNVQNDNRYYQYLLPIKSQTIFSVWSFNE